MMTAWISNDPFELVLHIILAIIASIPFAYLTGKGSIYFMECMEFGKIFWKVQFKAALRASKKLGLDPDQWLLPELEKVKKQLYADQADNMLDIYKQLAAKHPPFTRWICPVCMAGFISVFGLATSMVFIFKMPIAFIVTYSLTYLVMTNYFTKSTT